MLHCHYHLKQQQQVQDQHFWHNRETVALPKALHYLLI
jgi:hypothetical protein